MMRSPGPTKPHFAFTDDGLGDPFSITNDLNAWLAPVEVPSPAGVETASVGDLGILPGESAGNPTGSATADGTAAGAPAPTKVTTAGSSLVINLIWDTSVTSAPLGFMSDIIAAAQYLESQITNAVTINLNVGYNEINGNSLASGALGESQTNLQSVSYSALIGALTNTRSTDPTDTAVLASLPATSPVSGTYWLTEAQAKALGLLSANGTSIDGNIGFGLSSQFTYGDTNTSGTVSTGTYDFFAAAAHEITEVMGRLLLVGENIVVGAGYSLLDLLHYSAPGTRDFTQSTAGYLSVDGGATDLGDFNTNTPGDAGDWASSVGNNSFNAFATAGVIEPVTANDVTEMDAIGWNLAGSQPALVPPTISGTVAGQAVTDQATISPFSHVTIADLNAGQTETVTVSLSTTVNGSLSNLGLGGIYNASTGVYAVTGSATAVTAALDGLVFTPTAHEVPLGWTVTTQFTINDTDTEGANATDNATTVIATAIASAVPPTISGTVAGQTLTDHATIAPFSHVTIADLNAGQTETVTITLSATANGTLSNLGGGSYNPSTGVYTDMGTAAVVTTALDGLVFTPTAHQVGPGQSVTTGFTIKDADTAGVSVTDSTTTVIATALVPPTISGTKAGQTLTDQATIAPFSHVTIADLNAGQTETVTVTLSATAAGTLSNLGIGSYNASTGVYTVTGSAAAVTTALNGWVFDPTLLEAPAGKTVTTSFTISITDTAGESASDSTTSAITTETNNTSLIGILSADQQLELIYIAYFGRAADGPGLTFWAGQDVQAQAAGQSTAVALTNIANSFTPQPETLALYPFLGTPNLALNSPAAQAGLSTFIDNVYSNLFGHAPDANGKAYWVDQLTSGSVGLGATALAIANGATGADSIEVRNKITVALDFTTRTASAGLGNTAPLPSSFVTAAHTVLNGVDGNWLDDASTTSGMSATTSYISTSTTSTATTGSADTSTIMITGSDQLIDPGAGSHTLQFVAGVSADALVLHTNGTDQIAGFDPSTDVLDFRSLLSEANINLKDDVTALGKYSMITDRGSDALLYFDPTGHGGGSTVAVLQGLGSTVTGLDTLLAHGAIRIA